MTITKKISAIFASTALVFTGFAPAMAAPISPAISTALPIEASELGWSSEKETVNRHRRYRGYRGYGRNRHRRNRVDGGDIVAGILILGGIAAIASAASKNKRNRRYEDRDYRNERRSDNSRYDNRRSDERSDTRNSRGTGSMDQAINACADAAERKAGKKARVSEIRSVSKDGTGWRVEGDLSDSKERTFLCGSTDGRVDFVQLGTSDLAYNN